MVLPKLLNIQRISAFTCGLWNTVWCMKKNRAIRVLLLPAKYMGHGSRMVGRGPRGLLSGWDSRSRFTVNKTLPALGHYYYSVQWPVLTTRVYGPCSRAVNTARVNTCDTLATNTASEHGCQCVPSFRTDGFKSLWVAYVCHNTGSVSAKMIL